MWMMLLQKLRHMLRIMIPVFAMPMWIFVTAVLWRAKHYALVTLGMVILALLLFFAGLERRELGTRRMTLVAVMTALSVAGRLLPIFKPVTALTMLSAMYLGGEAGFLVGALSAVLSNFVYGQGPWTPFQMFAWGVIGLLAGCLRTPLRQSKRMLYGFGLLSGGLYSMLMDIWTVLWEFGRFSGAAYLTACYTALPHTILYAASNVLFLRLFAKSIGEKLERIRVKYGI